MTAARKPQVGIIGLGIMGSAYARNLLEAGYEVTGSDLDEAAVTTDENGREKCFLVIAGISILASMAASARLDPDRPPMTVDSMTFT